MNNILFATETVSEESTVIAYEVEANNGSPIATGSELLHDGGNDEIRASLRAACIAGLEKRFGAELYVAFPAEGVMLPTEEEFAAKHGSMHRGA